MLTRRIRILVWNCIPFSSPGMELLGICRNFKHYWNVPASTSGIQKFSQFVSTQEHHKPWNKLSPFFIQLFFLGGGGKGIFNLSRYIPFITKQKFHNEKFYFTCRSRVKKIFVLNFLFVFLIYWRYIFICFINLICFYYWYIFEWRINIYILNV